MIKDTATDSDVLTKQLAAAQKNLAECRSQIEKPEEAPETNTEIKYTRTDILELFKNINPKWKQSFLEADSAYRGKKSKSALISYRKLSQDIINDTTTNQDITAKALALVEDRIRELENPAPAKSSPGYLDKIQGEVNTKVKSNKSQDTSPDKPPQE